MALAINIIDGRGLSNKAYRELLPKYSETRRNTDYFVFLSSAQHLCAYDVLTMLYVIESDYFYLVPSINMIL